MNHRPTLRSWFRFFALSVALGFGASLACGLADYHRLKTERPVLFSRQTAILADGGTQEYVGFGYSIRNWAEMRPRDAIEVAHRGSRSGPELQFWYLPYRFEAIQYYAWPAWVSDPILPERAKGDSL